MANSRVTAPESLRRSSSLPSRSPDGMKGSGAVLPLKLSTSGAVVSAEASKLTSSMPKVPSFCSVFSPVFELELDSARAPASAVSREPLPMDRSFSDLQFYRQQLLAGAIVPTNSTLQKLLSLLKPTTSFEHQLSLHLRQLRISKGLNEIEAIAAELLALGYLVQIRDGCQPSKDNRSCLRNLRHRFLVCIGFQEDSYAEPHYLHEPLVVEPRFKEQFLIAHPSTEYELLLQAVPLSYVGALSRLEAVVKLLAGEVQEAFAQQGRALPPWRTQQAMLSKWAPQQLLDLAKLLCRPANSYAGDLTAEDDSHLQAQQPRQQGHQCNPRRRNSLPVTTRPVATAAAGSGVPGYSTEAGLFERTPSVPQQQQLLQQLKAQEEVSAATAAAAQHSVKLSQQAYRSPFAQAPLHKVLLQVVEEAARKQAAATESSAQPALASQQRDASAVLNPKIDTLRITRRSSSDLSKAATQYKGAKSMLAAALKCAPPKDLGGSRTVHHDEPWARFTTVRWGAAAAAAATSTVATAAVQF